MAEGQRSVLSVEQAALRLVARAEQTSSGLTQKLRGRGYPPAAVKSAVENLMQRGIVDDQRYAQLWVSARLMHKAESPKALILRLQQKGIDRKTAKTAVSTALDETSEPELLCRYLEKKGLNLNEPLLSGKLRAEGFSAAALEAVRERSL